MKNSLAWLLLLFTGTLYANNIAVNNMVVTGNNPAQGYALVQFDLTWENSWRTLVPNQWDAAWIFVKYRSSDGTWSHALLNNAGHSTGSGTASTIQTGLLDDNSTFNSTTNPGIGALVYRSGEGTGTYSATGIQLRWNYGANGLSSLATVADVKVFAIEMVLVRGGDFYIGDEYSVNSFRTVPTNSTFLVSTSGAAVKTNAVNTHDDSQFEGAGIWVDGDDGVSKSAATATDMNALYPTGYRGFYCMKYEITQGQYRDFLNTLTRTQQSARVESNVGGVIVSNTFVMSNGVVVSARNGLRCNATQPVSDPVTFYCDLDTDGTGNETNDGEWVACNYLGQPDGLAYLDWSGLRPMTELEYEKACRGPVAPVITEFAWGTNRIASATYNISSAGTASEGISSGYASNYTYYGNVAWSSTTGSSISGPLRVGIFAAHASNTGRVLSGAGYSGAMELTGNLYERAITLGTATGRSYTGLHGNGALSAAGSADVPNWSGAGFRGGYFGDAAGRLYVSERNGAGDNYSLRNLYYGFRGVRSVAPSVEGY